jgi:hypothetical protein
MCIAVSSFPRGRHLHNVLLLPSCSPVEDPTIRFSISSNTVFRKILLMPSPSSDTAAFRSRSLIPLLRSWRVRRLLSSVCSLGAPFATLSLPGPWIPCPLRSAGTACRPRLTANSCRGPFIRPSEAPYSQTPVPRPGLQGSHSFQCGLF